MILRIVNARTPRTSGRFLWLCLLLSACTMAGQGSSPDRGTTIRAEDPVLERGPISPAAEVDAAELFSRAEDAFASRRFSEAVDLSGRVVDQYPRAPVSGRALWLYLRAASELGLAEEADSAGERYIGLLPEGDPRISEARLLQAEALVEEPGAALDRLLRIPSTARRNDVLRAEPMARGAVGQLRLEDVEALMLDTSADSPLTPIVRARLAALLLQSGDEVMAAEVARLALEGGASGADAFVAEGVLRGELPPDLALVTSLTVAAVLPLGGSPQLAEFATGIAEGIEVAAATALGDRFEVEVVTMDDEGDPERSAELIRELEAERVAGVVGLLLDGTLEAAGQARAEGLPIISPTARSADLAGEATYSLEGADPQASHQIARYAASQAFERVAIVHSRAPQSAEEADTFQVAVESFGIPVVGRFGYDAGASDFEEQILSARDALRRAEIAALNLGEDDTLHIELLDPVAVYVPVPTEDVEFIAPQISHHALDTLGIQILGNTSWTDPTTLASLDELHTTGVVATARAGSGVLSPGYVRFQRAYEEHFQRSLVSPIPALGYDAALLLLEALREGRTAPAAVRASFERLREIDGATGIFTVVGDRVTRRTYVARIERGTLVPIG